MSSVKSVSSVVERIAIRVFPNIGLTDSHTDNVIRAGLIKCCKRSFASFDDNTNCVHPSDVIAPYSSICDHLCGRVCNYLFLFQRKILYAELLTKHFVEFRSIEVHEATLRGEGQFTKVYFSVYVI